MTKQHDFPYVKAEYLRLRRSLSKYPTEWSTHKYVQFEIDRLETIYPEYIASINGTKDINGDE